jgi:hypothetical protein
MITTELKAIRAHNKINTTTSTITDSLQSNESSNTPALDDTTQKQPARPKGTTKQQPRTCNIK